MSRRTYFSNNIRQRFPFPWTEAIIVVIIILIVSALILCCVDQGTSKPSAIKHCVVSEKHFEPAHTTYDSNNEPEVHPNRWHILVTPIFADVDVTHEQYEKLQTGKRVDILVSKGGVVGGEYYTIAPNLEEQ